MSNRYIKYSYIVLIVAISVISVVFIALLSVPSTPTFIHKNTLRIVCIYSGSSDYYKERLEEGLRNHLTEEEAWIEVIPLEVYEVERHCNEFEKAIASKVDGIITNAPDAKRIEGYIDKANQKGIPVVLIENDLPSSKRMTFVGANHYAYGQKAAELMKEGKVKPIEVAYFNDDTSNKYNIRNQGFEDSLDDTIRTKVFEVNYQSIIEYTNKARAIFLNEPNIDGFFCYNAESTMGLIRGMREFNKTNYKVIGSGDSQEIIDALEHGLVYVSLVENSYTIGWTAAQAMIGYLKGQAIPDAIHTEIMIITADNMLDFKR